MFKELSKPVVLLAISSCELRLLRQLHFLPEVNAFSPMKLRMERQVESFEAELTMLRRCADL